MIKAEQIPGEVVEALKDAANQWAMWLTDEEVRAALAAGLAAWPGADTDVNEDPFGAWEEKFLILPLQETPNAK
jgi:hypothetical protein